MRIRFDRLWYKFRDYEKFKRFITVIAKFQRDYRIKYMKRRLRHQIQQGRLISDTFDMIKHRLDFKKLISVVIFVQKTWKWIRFLRLIRFAKYIKELIYEHYDNQVWPEIRGLIQVRSCLKIQKTVRGHMIRCKYSEERTHLRIFKINLYQNFSAKKIQKIFKGWQVRTKLQEMEKAAIHIQAFVRGMRVRKVFKVVKKAAIVIQNYWRMYWFSKYAFSDAASREVLDPGTVLARLNRAEKEILNSLNFVPEMPLKDRKAKFSHKKLAKTGFVEKKEHFNNKEGRLYFLSYIADMEFLVDPSSYEMDSFGAAILEVMRQMADDSRSSLVYLNCGDTHFNAVSSRGSLFQWGKTDLGQLGFYSQGLVPICSVTETLDNGLPSISRIQLGFNHTIAYSADTNRLMAWGDNSKGQHGIGHFSLSSSISDLTHLIKKDCSVSMLECKANSTAVVLSDGSAYLWPYTAQDGSVSSTPMYAAFGKLKILSVSLGLDFSMFLISDGTLYSMGSSNKYGELGVGDTKPRFTPVKLKSLFDSGHLVVEASCGLKHTVVRTNAGKVLTWGWGERGQLGHGTTVSTGDPTPVKIKILNIPSSSCISVQAGYRSTFALLDCRKVLHWGTTGKMIRQLTPIEYSDPDDEIYFSKNSFKPVKVMTTWSRTISICYFLMADMRYMPAGKSPQWLDNQLKLANKQLPAHDSKLTLTR